MMRTVVDWVRIAVSLCMETTMCWETHLIKEWLCSIFRKERFTVILVYSVLISSFCAPQSYCILANKTKTTYHSEQPPPTSAGHRLSSRAHDYLGDGQLRFS